MKSKELYQQILGIEYPWEVTGVELSLEDEEVLVRVEYVSNTAKCPECGRECSIYDHRRERRWRHLDTCQLKTFIVCSVPRINCSKHGVLSIEVPWSESHSRFTVLFERLAIDMLLIFKKQKRVGEILRISFDQIHRIMKRAVERGLSRRDLSDDIRYIGIDEKSYCRGHSYITVLTDIDNKRVLGLIECRQKSSALSLIRDTLDARQREGVKAVCMDMWRPYINATRECLKSADIVHDRFHLMKYLNNAVDSVRREEMRVISIKERKILKGSRYIFLKNKEKWTDKQRTRFQQIRDINLKTSQAWLVKENFREYFNSQSINDAKFFFTEWVHNAKETGLRPIIEIVNLFIKHTSGIINYVIHKITNSISETMNSIIQEIIFTARGFKRYENLKTAILFFLGGLSLYP